MGLLDPFIPEPPAQPEDNLIRPIDRRTALSALGAGAGLLAAGPAMGLGASTRTGIALLQHGTGYKERPGAIEQLMWEVKKRTSIDVRERPALVEPSSQALYDWPLLYWVGVGDTPPFSDDDLRRLSRFLRAGGLLFIDDASPQGSDAFDRRARREIARLMPDTPLRRISNDHTIYRSFFLLREPSGRVRRQGWLEGVEFDDRSPILYGRNDLLGALARDAPGTWRLPVRGGSIAREMAFRFGINLLMYATCLNYKRDQVHVTAILRRRRWRVDGRGPTR